MINYCRKILDVQKNGRNARTGRNDRTKQAIVVIMYVICFARFHVGVIDKQMRSKHTEACIVANCERNMRIQ